MQHVYDMPLTFVSQSSSSDGAFLPRHAALKTGVPLEKPAFGVNRLCGSGFQAIVSGAQVGQRFCIIEDI